MNISQLWAKKTIDCEMGGIMRNNVGCVNVIMAVKRDIEAHILPNRKRKQMLMTNLVIDSFARLCLETSGSVWLGGSKSELEMEQMFKHDSVR